MNDILTNLSQMLSTLDLIKLAILIIIGLYSVFAFVVFNQVLTMNNLIRTSLGSVFIFAIALLDLLLTISLFLLALAIL